MSMPESIPVLIAQTGTVKGQRWNLNRDEVVVGRDGKCDIVINDKTVSRRHARFYRRGGQWYLEDTSKNGTFINEQPLKNTVAIHDGDTISIATATKLAFVGSEATVPLSMDDSPTRGRLRLDPEARRVWVSDQELNPPLSLPQYRLLELLFQNKGRVCTREMVVAAVWPEAQGDGVSEQSIDALVRRVRDRLSELDQDNQYIITVRGHGFRLENPS
jgi:DNA-binding winged helix-turn-helix (wHTH) protein